MNTRKTILSMILLVAFGSLLSACDNTIRGVGKDINETADAVEDSTE